MSELLDHSIALHPNPEQQQLGHAPGAPNTATFSFSSRPPFEQSQWYFISCVRGQANNAYQAQMEAIRIQMEQRKMRAERQKQANTNEHEETSTSSGSSLEEELSESDDEIPNSLRPFHNRKSSPDFSPHPVLAASSPSKLSTAPTSTQPLRPHTSHSADPPPLYDFGSFGQDAYFVASDDGVNCIGVADGVGGWRQNGVDSGEMARAMMRTCQQIARELRLQERPQFHETNSISISKPTDSLPTSLLAHISPSSMLIEAYSRVHKAKQVEAGSTTACIVALKPLTNPFIEDEDPALVQGIQPFQTSTISYPESLIPHEVGGSMYTSSSTNGGPIAPTTTIREISDSELVDSLNHPESIDFFYSSSAPLDTDNISRNASESTNEHLSFMHIDPKDESAASDYVKYEDNSNTKMFSAVKMDTHGDHPPATRIATVEVDSNLPLGSANSKSDTGETKLILVPSPAIHSEHSNKWSPPTAVETMKELAIVPDLAHELLHTDKGKSLTSSIGFQKQEMNTQSTNQFASAPTPTSTPASTSTCPHTDTSTMEISINEHDRSPPLPTADPSPSQSQSQSQSPSPSQSQSLFSTDVPSPSPSTRSIDIPATVGTSAHTHTDISTNTSFADLSPSVCLTTANLGDSGYVVVRDGKVVIMSDFQREGGIVKQLAVIPPRYQNSSYCDDDPSEAIVTSYAIYENDIIILASDGLFDNLCGTHNPFPSFMLGMLRVSSEASELEKKIKMKKRMETIIHQCYEKLQRNQWNETAQKDTTTASTTSPSSSSSSPSFATIPTSADDRECCAIADSLKQEALTFMNTLEGKPDDLTIVVAKVKRKVLR